MLKLHQKITIKTSNRLFNDKWQYKTSVICPAGAWFRGNNLPNVAEKFADWTSGKMSKWDWLKIKTAEDFEYCVDIYKILLNRDDYTLRVEHPIVSLYTNNQKLAYELANIDPSRTKFVFVPPTDQSLIENTVIMKRITHGYKVTMGRSRHSHENFTTWARKTKNIKISKRTLDIMCKPNWGGCYFYVKDDATMTMVKMFLGSDIARIDKVITSNK